MYVYVYVYVYIHAYIYVYVSRAIANIIIAYKISIAKRKSWNDVLHVSTTAREALVWWLDAALS